ncbi:hypothetical protein AOQ84DRAFT_264978, partial [Glonium stellatum]
NLEFVNLLLNAKVDINSANGNPPALCLAAENRDATVVDLLLRRGADAKVKDPYGDTPLHTCLYKFLDKDEEDNIVHICSTECCGRTALQLAIKGGHI